MDLMKGVFFRSVAVAALCAAAASAVPAADFSAELRRTAGVLTRDTADTHGALPAYVLTTTRPDEMAELHWSTRFAEKNREPAVWEVWCKVESKKNVMVWVHGYAGFEGSEPSSSYHWWEPGWHRIAGNFRSPRDLEKFSLYFSVKGGPAVVRFADFSFRRGPVPAEIVSVAPISNRPFEDTLQLDVTFSRELAWTATPPGGASVSGKGVRASLTVPAGTKRVPFVLKDGATEVKTTACVADLAKCPYALRANPVAADAVDVWTTDSMVRVTPLTYPSHEGLVGWNRSVDFELCRRERESAQLVVTTGAKREFASCSVELSPLVRTDGVPFRGAWTWQRVGFVPRVAGAGKHPESPSPLERWIPDPLLSAAPFRVRRDASQPVWLTASADPAAAPGVYRGVAKVTGDGRTLAEIPVEIRVRDFELPRTFGMPTAFSLMHSWIKAYYPENFRAQLRAAQDLMLDARLNPDDISRYEPPYVDDLLHARARGMNRFNCMNVIPQRGPTEDKLSWKCFPSEKEVQDPLFVTNFMNRLKPFVAEIRKHGLDKLAYVYGYDERGGPVYTNSMRQVWEAMRAETPGIPLITTGGIYGDYLRLYKKLGRDPSKFPWESVFTDWFCPLTSNYDKEFAEQMRRHGRQTWWYTCCAPVFPYANQAGIEYPLIEGRLLGWQMHERRSDGWLFWHVNMWASPKLNESDVFFPSHRYPLNTPGDGVFLYPGATHVLGSLRLSTMRDSVEDYEYLQLLAAKKGQAAADAVSTTLYGSMTSFTRDPARIRRARRAVADAIEVR